MDEDDFISKTRRKRQAHDLQALGAALVKLSPERLARLDLPEELKVAVLDARKLSKHEAVRRQLQYIGKIMRGIDADPIAEQLNALEAPSRKQTAVFHVAEKWRLLLLADPSSVADFVKDFPETDADKLREAVTAAAEERQTSKPPRKFRDLFHMINAILQEHAKKET